MGTKEKLIERFKSQPKDFTWEELVRLFGIFGFKMYNKGKTSGSRAIFEKENYQFLIHKPHPKSIIKKSALKQTLHYLTENNYL